MTHRPEGRRPGREEGNISLFVLGVLVSLLVVIGLAMDGSKKFQAASDATFYAQQAALTGDQALNVAGYLSNGTVDLDPQAAVAAADAYLATPSLAAAGVTGSAILLNPTTLQVTVTITRPTEFLGLIGIPTQTVTASATAALLHGVTTPER